MTNPGNLARRYAPFLVLAAVQVLLVALVPSTGGGSNVTAGPFGGGGGGGAGDGTLAADGSDGTGGFAPDGTPLDGSGGASGGGAGGAGGGGGGGGSGGGRGGLTGDRSKCGKNGIRQQDVTIASPPCVPRFVGDNGGATYKQGVTKDEVVVLRYRPKSNAQVDAILRTQGLASSPDEERAAQDAFAKFFEKHYEFYNRKIRWEWVQGTCEISPFDPACFRDEVKRLNDRFKPFMVFYTGATTQAEFFEQWTQLGVVNLGGWHFNASFNTANRPFHYDVFMDGSRTARNLANYWCQKLEGKNASLAGTPDLQNRKRKLGILTQNFEVTRRNAQELYNLVTGGMCGTKESAALPQYTPSDITQSQSVARTAMQKFEDEGVTTVVLMTDPINPFFSSRACTDNQWFPEHLLAGSGLIDYDVLGRLYDQTQWIRAFGPGHLAEPIPFPETDASKAARDVGVNQVYSGANLLYGYMSLVAAQVQMAGPNLRPETVERGTLTLPAYGGWERTKNPASILIQFGPGDYTAIEDSRHAWWDPQARSKIDNGQGAYRSVNGGQRWEIGKWTAGEPKQ